MRDEGPDERGLVARTAAGDEAAFHALYTAYYARIWRYVWYHLDGQPARVEDATQDIFFAVWRAARHFRGDSRVATWIFQIAHNFVMTARSKQSKQIEALAPGVAEDDRYEEDVDASGPSFEEELVDRLLLVEAINQLSPKHQAVLYLVFEQGFSLPEVAHILGVPRNTVKSRLLLARRALRACLRPAGLKEGGKR